MYTQASVSPWKKYILTELVWLQRQYKDNRDHYCLIGFTLPLSSLIK